MLILLIAGMAPFCMMADGTDSLKLEGFGQWRTYYQGTINDGNLKNFHALATGGKAGFELTYGILNFRTVGYLSVNTGIQDLTIPDETTGRVSRYEAGLFDVNDLSKTAIPILGELSLGFKTTAHDLKIGRFKLLSPLINPQDGRMIPTLEEGVWYQFHRKKKFKADLGWIHRVAPRSTAGFTSIEESFGLYPVGRNLDGSPSGYRNNIESDFILFGGIQTQISEAIKVNLWNYYVDNVFNTTYSRVYRQSEASGFFGGVEWVHQRRLSEGGNQLDSLTYFASETSNVIGAQFGRKLGQGRVFLSYDHILDGGRFLFPREWGRESLFTFQKRERTDGSAGNHALVVTYDFKKTLGKGSIRSIWSLGHQWKQPVTDPFSNKYALPSYRHLNLDFFYAHPKLPQLKPELILVFKQSLGDFPDNPNFILNKVDLFQINFIANYNF